MTLFFLLFVLVIIGYSFKNFKRAFFIFISISILLNPGIAIKYSPPAITVSLALTLFFIVMFYFKKEQFKSQDKCFFGRAFALMIASYTISMFIAYFDGNKSALTYTINLLASRFIIFYVLWRLLETSEDIRFLHKWLGFIFTAALAYGVYEFTTNSNPVLEYIESVIPEEFSANKLYLSDLENTNRGGRARYQSLFYITIEYGMACLMYAFFLLQTKTVKSWVNRKKIITIALFVLCFFALWACNSKTPLVALPIFILPYFVKSFRNLVIASTAFLVLSSLPIDYLALLNNVIDVSSLTGGSDEATGSTLDMRLIQLGVSLDAFRQAPIFGMGIRYASILAEINPDLLGAESCWFKLLIEQGAFGIIAFSYIIISFVREGLRIDEDRFTISFYAIAFFVMCSITDIAYDVFFILFILMVKSKMLSSRAHNIR